jgi:hypothetical protein
MRRGSVLGVVVVAALTCVLLPPAAAVAGRAIDAGTGCRTVFCAEMSSDGSRIVFTHHGELTAGAGPDRIYEWNQGGLQPLTFPGAAERGRLELDGSSADATHVFVSTSAPLSSDDADGSGWDVFDLHDRASSLVSTGPLDVPADPILGAFFKGASPDGSRVFFDDFRPLTSDDLDRCPDLYERAGGQTRLIGPNPKPPPWPICEFAEFGGVSRDGSHLFFVSGVGLEPGDEEGDDIYQQVGTGFERLTTYPKPDWNCVESPRFIDSSSDGGTILFSTNSAIAPEDTNRALDLYKRRADGTFALVSRAMPSSEECGFWGVRGVALSADGSTAIFETGAQLRPEDRDSANDLYSAADDGTIELVSTGPTDPQVEEPTIVYPDWIALVSDDAKTVAFETRQRLVETDRDNSPDVYVRVEGETKLISAGLPGGPSAGPPAELSALAADGSAVVFATREALVAGDANDERDVYRRRIDSKRTTLLSAETIPPRISVSRRAARLRGDRVAIRMTCPAAEQNGPCHGWVKLTEPRRGKALGRAAFRIAVGKRGRIAIRLHRPLPPTRHNLATRVRAIDQLGNASRSVKTIHLAG